MAKVIFWGLPVGKTSLIERLLDSDYPFSEGYLPTPGIDFKLKKFGTSNIQIWDPSGQKQWQNLGTAYLHNLNAVFLCFDPQDEASFGFLKLSLAKIKEADKECELILIETKSDLAGKKMVSEKQINQFKKEHDIHHHIKTSAKTGQGLDETRILLVKKDESNCNFFMLNTFYAVAAISCVALLITAAVTFSIPLATAGLLVGGAGLITGFLFFDTQKTKEKQTSETFDQVCCGF